MEEVADEVQEEVSVLQEEGDVACRVRWFRRKIRSVCVQQLRLSIMG